MSQRLAASAPTRRGDVLREADFLRRAAMDPHTEPDFSTAALVTIDTQCDTLDGQPMEIPGTSAVLPNMRALIAGFVAAGRPVVHIVRIYLPDGANVDLCRRQAVAQGRGALLADTPGCQPAPGLLPQGLRLDCGLLLAGGIQPVGPGQTVIYKPRWGAFYQTPLHDHLQAMGATTLVFAGCNYPNCPRTSIYEASERDYRIVLARDAISGLYERGAREMANIGVRLMSTARVLAAVAA